MMKQQWLRWRPSCPKLSWPSFKLPSCWKVSGFQKFQKPSWVLVFQLLFAEATLPGLRNVFGFSPPIPRVVFALVFVYLVLKTVKDIDELVENYLEYNTTLQVKIIEPWDGYAKMPAVTICNKNPILKSKFCNVTMKNRIDTETNKTCSTPNCESFISLYYQQLCFGGKAVEESFRVIFGFRNNSIGRTANKKFTEWYEELMRFEKGRELLGLLSYPESSSLIRSCSFNEKDCAPLLQKVLLPTYGNCFCLFCEGEERVMNFDTHLNGLSVHLNVMENESLPMIMSSGHLIMIHHPEEEINDSEDAVFIYPRATTYIGLQKERVLRLPPPTTDPCTETYPPDLYPRIEPKAKQSYSLRVCQELCTQMAVYKACNCLDFKFLRPVGIATIECSYVIPSGAQNSSLTCALDVIRRVENIPNRCGCFRSCVEEVYRKTNSALFWHPKLQKNFGNSSTSTVFVYMRSNKITIRQKVLQTTWKDLLNSIAGTMGLYLGYSYLFAFYIVDILVRGIAEIASWAHYKRRQKRLRHGKNALRNMVFNSNFR